MKVRFRLPLFYQKISFHKNFSDLLKNLISQEWLHCQVNLDNFLFMTKPESDGDEIINYNEELLMSYGAVIHHKDGKLGIRKTHISTC